MTTISDNSSVLHISSFQKFVTWILVLSPILQTYGWGKYDFAFILTSIAGVLAIINKQFDYKKLPKFLLLYLCYLFFVHIISATSIQSSISLGAIKTILVYGTFFSVIPLTLLIRYYQYVVRISIAFFIIQLIIKFFFSINLLGVFSFLPNALGVDSSEYFADRMSSDRLSSFFSEPAIFAQYLVPYFCLILFDKHQARNSKLVSAVFLVVVFVLMQSGNALFGLSSCIVIFFLFRMRGGVSRKIQTVFLASLLLVSGFFFFQTEMGEKLLSRKDQVSINSVENLGYSTSGFERIFRGYYIYAEYSTFCKIVGNDNPDYKKASALKSLVGDLFSTDTEDFLYCNTFQMVLINTGLIGLIIMFLAFKGIWQTTNCCGKDMLLTFFAFSLFTATYLSEIMCLYLLIPTLMGRTKTNYE